MARQQDIIERTALQQLRDGMLYADRIEPRHGRYSVINVAAGSASHPPFYPLVERGFQIVTGFDHAHRQPYFAWHVTRQKITTADAAAIPPMMTDVTYAYDGAALIGTFMDRLGDVETALLDDIAGEPDLSRDGRWETKTHVFHANANCMTTTCRDRSKKRNPDGLITSVTIRSFDHLRR